VGYPRFGRACTRRSRIPMPRNLVRPRSLDRPVIADPTGRAMSASRLRQPMDAGTVVRARDGVQPGGDRGFARMAGRTGRCAIADRVRDLMCRQGACRGPQHLDDSVDVCHLPILGRVSTRPCMHRQPATRTSPAGAAEHSPSRTSADIASARANCHIRAGHARWWLLALLIRMEQNSHNGVTLKECALCVAR